jgi:hypothetical protein
MIYIDRLQVTTTATYVFPLSTTIGFKPNSINRKAANSPAGPAPMTITSCAVATFPYSGSRTVFSLKVLLSNRPPLLD